MGICLGMQLLTKSSEEGTLPGLGYINAKTVKFQPDLQHPNIKIPHMGWDHIIVNHESKIFKEFTDEMRFYFVHSYYVVCEKEQNVIAKTHYGLNFACAINSENIYGVQFHPEKSHKFGMKLLSNFAEFC